MAAAAVAPGVCAPAKRPTQHPNARGSSIAARPSWGVAAPRRARAAAAAGGSSTSTAAAVAPPKDPFAEKTEYKDNLFDRAMIWYFSSVMSKQLGNIPFDGSWNDFVQLSRE